MAMSLSGDVIAGALGTVVSRWSQVSKFFVFLCLEKEVCNICIKVKEAGRKASGQVCSFLFSFYSFFFLFLTTSVF